MNRQRFLLPALLLLTVARLLILPLIEITPVEEYIVKCSHENEPWHPGVGPVLPLMVKASSSLLGDGGLGIRCLAPLLILGASWLLWELTRGMFDSTTASWTLVIFQLTPAVNIAAVTMTLSTIGIACSIAALAALRSALHRKRRWHMEWWLLGVTFAVPILVDWRLSMLVVSCAAGMASTQRGRRALLKWPVLPVLACSVGLIVGLLLFWNAKHGWPAFSPLPNLPPLTLWKVTWHMLLGLSPWLLLACGWSLARGLMRQPPIYPVTLAYAFLFPLIVLDCLAWAALPWPHCGFASWIAPATLLLSQQSIHWEKTPARLLIGARWLLLLAMGAQSGIVMQQMISGGSLMP